MCGIAGILDLGNGTPPKQHELEAMIAALHHRGPDGYGFYLRQEIGLAHARLSIIDLAGGDQPIRNEDGSVQVVFNGEIFNHLELGEALDSVEHRICDSFDTEVIGHLFEQH